MTTTVHTRPAMTAEERLEKLEKEVAALRTRTRRVFWTAGGILGVLALLGAAQPTTGTTSRPTVIRADEVRAYRFIVEDHHTPTKGNQEAIFGMIQDAPGLRLGPSDKPQISLSTHGGTYLYLADETGNPRATLQVVGDRSSLSLFNSNQQDLLDIALSWDSPSLTLTDENGKVLWQTPAKGSTP